MKIIKLVMLFRIGQQIVVDEFKIQYFLYYKAL